jgi:hypothetical protein
MKIVPVRRRDRWALVLIQLRVRAFLWFADHLPGATRWWYLRRP